MLSDIEKLIEKGIGGDLNTPRQEQYLQKLEMVFIREFLGKIIKDFLGEKVKKSYLYKIQHKLYLKTHQPFVKSDLLHHGNFFELA